MTPPVTTPTAEELVFMKRMLPHYMAGKSATEAADAVLTDDARLLTSLLGQTRYQLVEGAAGDGGPILAAVDREQPLESALSAHVYHLLRYNAHLKGQVDGVR